MAGLGMLWRAVALTMQEAQGQSWMTDETVCALSYG